MSSPLFWPQGRKLFRQRPSSRAVVSLGVVLVVVALSAVALLKMA